MAVPVAPPTFSPPEMDDWAQAVTDSIIVLLAEAEFNPATLQTQTTTSATFAQLSSGGSTPEITFTMPASGEVVIEAEFWSDGDTNSTVLAVALWESAAVVTGTERGARGDQSTASVPLRWRITGTPAASRTIGLAISRMLGTGSPGISFGILSGVNLPVILRAFQMDPV